MDMTAPDDSPASRFEFKPGTCGVNCPCNSNRYGGQWGDPLADLPAAPKWRPSTRRETQR